jgi:hypothetical protein
MPQSSHSLPLLALCVVAAPIAAGSPDGELAHSNPHAYQQYGYAVDIDGSTAVVGAPYDETLGERAGEVHVWELDDGSWTHLQTLSGEAVHAPEEYDYFGYEVKIDGEAILVWHAEGGPEEHSPGIVETFRRDSVSGLWSSSGVLEGWYDTSGSFDDIVDDFGQAMAIDGDIVAIGGSYFSWNENKWTGQAWTFSWNGASWDQMERFAPDSPGHFDGFGDAIALEGGVIVVGAPNRDGNDSGDGAAFVFEYNGASWNQKEMLYDSDGDNLDSFGHAVAISGGVIAAANYQDDDNGYEAGSVRLFEKEEGSWTEIAVLYECRAQGGSDMGIGLDIDGDTVAVGARGFNDTGTNDGAVMVFQRQDDDTWPQVAHLSSEDIVGQAYLGFNVAIEGNTIMAGAPGQEVDDGAGSTVDAGTVLVWDGPWADDWDGDGQEDWSQLAVGDSHDWDGNCIPDEADCIADFTSSSWSNPDGVVDSEDLLQLVAYWGGAGSGSSGMADLNEDDLVALDDLLWVLATWGDCP